MHHASNSDLLAFPLQQQPLGRPPTSPPRSHRSSAPTSPCLLVFHSVSGTRPCSMQRPQTFSPFRSSSSPSANRLALAYPRHQRPAFVLGSHAKGEERNPNGRRFDALTTFGATAVMKALWLVGCPPHQLTQLADIRGFVCLPRFHFSHRPQTFRSAAQASRLASALGGCPQVISGLVASSTADFHSEDPDGVELGFGKGARRMVMD